MTSPMPSPITVANAIAPGGTLRAAINLGNIVLAQRGAAGELQGTSVQLAQEAARRLGLPLELVPFDAAGQVVEALQQDAWDLAFMGPAATPEQAFAHFCDGQLQALAGVRPALLRLQECQPGLRVLRDSFLTVRQAMALPRRAAAAQPWFDAFIAGEMASGLVQSALAETGQAEAAFVPTN